MQNRIQNEIKKSARDGEKMQLNDSQPFVWSLDETRSFDLMRN